MQWWLWVLIWVGLIALLIVVFVVGAVSLWRKAQAALREFDRLEWVQQEAARIAAEVVAEREERARSTRRSIAFGRSSRAVREYHVRQRQVRRARLVAKRAERVARGRALTKADPMQFAHLIHHPKKG